MTTADISKMTVIERLQTMEALWDSLTHESTEIKSPTWHSDVLSERKEKIKKW
jgi:Putative addiction module component.